MALLPKESVANTRLRDLNTDRFEITNLSYKNLIVIPDSENFVGDLSILKAYVGNDAIKGSVKYVQGSVDVNPVGLLLILGNHTFSTKNDPGGALFRRLIPFPTVTISNSREPLIRNVGENFEGPLAEELPGIFN